MPTIKRESLINKNEPKYRKVSLGDVAEKYSSQIILSFFSFWAGILVITQGVGIGLKELIGTSIFLIVVLLYLLWVQRSYKESCRRCLNEFVLPGTMNSSEYCRNCLYERFKSLKS